jgi:hypothetical protein
MSGAAGEAIAKNIKFIGGTTFVLGISAMKIGAPPQIYIGIMATGVAIYIGGEIYDKWGTVSDIDEARSVTKPITDQLNEQKKYLKQLQEETGECVIKE